MGAVKCQEESSTARSFSAQLRGVQMMRKRSSLGLQVERDVHENGGRNDRLHLPVVSSSVWWTAPSLSKAPLIPLDVSPQNVIRSRCKVNIRLDSQRWLYKVVILASACNNPRFVLLSPIRNRNQWHLIERLHHRSLQPVSASH